MNTKVKRCIKVIEDHGSIGWPVARNYSDKDIVWYFCGASWKGLYGPRYAIYWYNSGWKFKEIK